MSSNISRIQQALWVARREGRKVAFVGFSIERNVKVATELGFLKIPPRLVVDKHKIKSIPKQEQCLIIAGSQGQLGSSLERIATGEHKQVVLDPGDKVIFSADPIPGNEANVYRMIDMLSRHKLTVSYSDISDDLHVSGHASAEEMIMLMAMTKPQYVMPTGGTYRHMIHYGKLAAEFGIPTENILMPENQQLVLDGSGVRYGDTLNLKTVYVESGEITENSEHVHDRRLMFQEGAVVAVISRGAENGRLDVDLIPRGLSHPLEGNVMQSMKEDIAKFLGSQDISQDSLYSKDKISKEVSRLFIKYVGKNPVVIPVIIQG